jgi:hypothetical protein
MEKFYVDDCPKELPVADWIKSQIKWRQATNDVTASSPSSTYMDMVFEFTGNLEGLKQSVTDALNTYGFFGWRTSEGDEKFYGGYSITYNPNLQYDDQDIHQHTLGTRLNAPSDFYAGSSVNHEFLKNSYLDGMSFNEFTPAAKIGYMGELLEDINSRITITRSRLGIVKGSEITDYNRYHVDSEIFELCRLNIPVIANENFAFQFHGRQPYVLEEGRAYTWQTEFPHRVYCHEKTNLDRANMVIGLSPWLSYNKEERYWYTNEFYGKKHPFDIIIDGHVTDKVKFLGAR